MPEKILVAIIKNLLLTPVDLKSIGNLKSKYVLLSILAL